MRSIVRTLVLTVMAAVAVAAAGAQGPTTPVKPASGVRYTAYYFHGKFRCPTCLKIEKLSEEAVRQNYQEMISQGVLTWKAVNTDIPENRHFNSDFNLTASALVLTREVNSKVQRFQVVDQVWEWVSGSDPDFVKNVDEVVAAFLAKR